MKLYHTLALTALLAVGAAGGSFAGDTAKTAKPAHKTSTAAVTQYECTHCNVKLSAKDAKAHGYKCPDCGMKMTAVKPSPKTGTKAKKS
jgi:DNA-directed RNA polymerase subunit RPC12/RpoP